MKLNIKRLAWLACRNIAIITAAIFACAALIIGTIYVLATVFGPAGMTVILPFAIVLIIAVAVAYDQMRNEEHHNANEIRKKLAAQDLATPHKTVSNAVKPSSKAVSK